VPRRHPRNGKLVSWSQPMEGASINARFRSVILPNKPSPGLRRPHRAGRIGRMAAHSHDHSHAGHAHSAGHTHAGQGHASHAHPALRPSVLGWAMAATLGLVWREVFAGFWAAPSPLLPAPFPLFPIFPPP